MTDHHLDHHLSQLDRFSVEDGEADGLVGCWLCGNYVKPEAMGDVMCKDCEGLAEDMNMISRFLLWLVMDSSIRLGRLASWVFGLAIGRRPHRVQEEDECSQDPYSWDKGIADAIAEDDIDPVEPHELSRHGI